MHNWRELFSNTALNEGRIYYSNGKAKKLSFHSDNGYSAIVRGARNYKVSVLTDEYGQDLRDMSCTCPHAQKGGSCKHMAAVLYLIEKEYGSLKVDEETVDRFREKEEDAESDLQAGADREKEDDASSSMLPKDQAIVGEIAKLQEEELLQIRKEQEEEDGAEPPRHMEPYRYFHYENYGKCLKYDSECRRKAEKLLKSGKISEVTVETGYPSAAYRQYQEGPSTIIGVASASMNKGYDRVRMVFDSDRIIESNCTDWRCRRGYYIDSGPVFSVCEHELAVYMELIDFLKKNNPGDATSLGGRNLMDMADRGQYQIGKPGEFEAAAVTISPLVEWEEYEGDIIPTASFRTGVSRMYKIRSIPQFVKAVKAGEEMTFGTKTTIRLGEELLTEESKPWFRFLEDALKEEKLRNRALNAGLGGSGGWYSDSSGSLQIRDSIPLFGSSLDRFYQLAEGKTVEFSIRNEIQGYGRKSSQRRKEELLFCEEHLDVQIEIEPWFGDFQGAGGSYAASGGAGAKRKAEGKGLRKNVSPAGRDGGKAGLQGIRITGEMPQLLEGRDASYYKDEDSHRFCRVSREQVEKLAPLRRAMENGRIDARIGRRNLRDFYNKLMPHLREAVNVVEYNTDLIASYLPPEPVFVFYFDLENGTVLCRPDVHYGLQIHTILDILPGFPWSGLVAPYRDLEKETGALDVLRKYIREVEAELRVLLIRQGDEEALFNLLAFGLEELMGIGEVRMTEAFRRLGLRRHTRFSIGVSVESNLLDLQILSEDLSEEELIAAFYQYQKKRRFVRLKNGDFLQLDKNETIDRLLEIMETMGVTLKDFVRGRMQAPAYRALYLDKMLEQMQDVYTNRDRRFKTLIKEFKTVEDADYEVPASLRGVLRKYQVAGYRWLRTLDQYGFGGILADEMGLGKTLQVIAVLLADQQNRQERDLPADQQYGQERELPADQQNRQERELPADQQYGQERELPADQQYRQERDLPAEKEGAEAAVSLVVCPASLVYNWGEELRRFASCLRVGLVVGTKRERSLVIENYLSFDVMVTSYDLLKRDIDEYEGKSFRFEIIDEAQYIKNQGTAAAKSVKLIGAKTRFALTGTPIENRLSELWSIFDYLMPGFLYTYSQFHSDFEQAIVKFEDEAAAERLRRMASPFILRRRKEDVLRDLPEKLEEVRYAGMESKQKKLYDGQVLRMKKTMEGQSEADFRKGRIQILAELTKIRQICCDPNLILANYDGGSAKRDACMELLRNVIEGEHKALVFSQFASMLELLEKDLEKEGISYFKITGATSKERRMEMVRSFNEDDTPVFLISLKAGGTGLNLTGADVVIHYDPWWNVAAQNQATDRAHRIGQTKVVTVYRLIVKGTIEERILEMQEAKKKLAEDILSSESISSSTISREDLLALLG